MRQGEVAQFDLTAQVDGHHPIIIIHVDGGEGTGTSSNPRIANQNVDPAMMTDRAIDQRGQLPGIGHVGGNGERTQFPADAVASVRILAGNDDLRTMIPKGAGNRKADAARRSGDDRDLPVQIEQGQCWFPVTSSGFASGRGRPLWR